MPGDLSLWARPPPLHSDWAGLSDHRLHIVLWSPSPCSLAALEPSSAPSLGLSSNTTSSRCQGRHPGVRVFTASCPSPEALSSGVVYFI